VLWGLIAGGPPGVSSVYAHIAAEMRATMLLSGVAKPSDIKREHVAMLKE
jgi:isopentenyl diphosphate isomerase/L-lactate dehydrogenase-like FMN-dependent dehydrogenase